MSFVNIHILFKKEDTENLINGITTPKMTQKAYLSVKNDRGFSRLFSPVAKAAVLTVADGHNIMNTALSSAELMENGNVVAAVAKIDDNILAEYIDTKKNVHLCCYNETKKTFLFGGISSDGGKIWRKYSVIKKDTEYGVCAWLCLYWYIACTKGDPECGKVLKSTYKASLIDEYKNMADGKAVAITNAVVSSSLFVLCDCIYHTIGANEEVYVNSTGYLPDVPQDLSAYQPTREQMVVGDDFQLFSDDSALGISSEDLTPTTLFCKYKIAEYDKDSIPKMPDTYVVPQWVGNLAEYTQFYHNSNLSPELKPKNYLIFGGAGSGKTQGAMALASALGLPFYYINCSSNTDESAFKGEIMPQLDNVNKAGNIEDFSEFKEEVDMSPEYAYKELTGIEKNDVTEEECFEAYINAKAAEKSNNSNRISYYFKESPFIKGVREGGVVVVEEFTNVRDSGVGIALNELMDGHMSFTLPTGEVVKRNENTIIVFCANVDERNCNEFEASMKSRFHQRIKVETPQKEELIQRVSAMTGFTDSQILEKMATVVMALAQATVSKGINGTCGVREFANWVLSYSFNAQKLKRFEENKLLRQTALSTVITGCALHAEEIEELTNEVLLNLLG